MWPTNPPMEVFFSIAWINVTKPRTFWIQWDTRFMGPDGQTTNQAENRFTRARAATSGPQGAWGCSRLLAFFTPNVSVHGRELKVLQSKRTVPCCFSPRIKLPFKSLAALSGKKKDLETPLELCTGGQLKFLETQFRTCLGAVHS